MDIDTCRIDARGQAVSGPGAIWPWWSVTKTLIAATALRLQASGTVALDAPIRGLDATLAELLSHTAGCPDYGRLPAYHAAVAAGEAPWPRARLLAEAGPRLFPASHGWHYSNIGMMLAREHLEEATGAGLAELLQDHIAGPLGLGSLRLARAGDIGALPLPGAAAYDPGWVYHGCALGTAADAARAMQAILDRTLLGPATDRLIRSRPLGGPLPGRPWSETGYGLGLMSGRMGAAGRALGHSGGGPFSACAVYHFPDRADGPTVAVFTPGSGEARAESRAAELSAP